MINKRKLIKKLNDSANIIHNANLRGSANFIIVSPELAETIENLDIKKHRKKKLQKIKKLYDNQNSEQIE